ncbi:hypothetical protein CERZMDRAFT_103319 [Cercospora zeae-maydis SCOH1-5]|uniref:Large ribosomal subunit protein mL67 n=1 Tax=Cercospora zeae-maydis SCOH1-5 TaxID=717836 RepID=A0A6A6EZH2_9PEZI|nr:hypothetical protein CERZMDRAFT_103319 [Cercospora zeae-maydis SCOH1-5]
MQKSVGGAAQAPWAARAPMGKGQAIYAYCNIRTNQVLYSLERTLRQSHLKQLADAGANNNPPKIRKDIWRPLFTVHLPDRLQGLDVFRSLREYRRLHETTWELPESIKQPFTEKQIERMEEKLKNRGGSKEETVFDVIKRKKKSMRARMVMDQKANSVADLAAILLRQQQRSAQLAADKKGLMKRRNKRMIEEIVTLSDQYERHGTTKIDERIAKSTAQATEAGRKSRDKKSTTRQQRKEQYLEAQAARQAAARYRAKKVKMEWSFQAVKEAKQMAATEAASREQAVIAEEDEAKAANGPDSKPPPREPIQVDYKQFIQSYPAELDPMRALFEGQAFDKKSPLHTLTLAQSKDLREMKRPVFSIKGTTVQWANVLDAEYAELWPRQVKHLNMGFVRNTAPEAGTEGIHDVSEFKGQQRKSIGAGEDRAVEDAVEDAEPVAEHDFVIEAQAEPQKQEESRRDVLEKIKKQILDDLKMMSGTPSSRWPGKLLKLRQRRTAAAREQEKQTMNQGPADHETLPAEPTSSENAPSL